MPGVRTVATASAAEIASTPPMYGPPAPGVVSTGAVLASVPAPVTATTAVLQPATFTSGLPDGRARIAIATAMAQVGLPYVWGGDGPTNGDAGFDCSGLTKFAYAAAGVTLPRTAHTQYYAGPHVPTGAALQPGDLVFYGTSAFVHHVGMYIGAGRMVNAPTFGKPVQTAYYRWNGDDYLGATRPAASGGGTTGMLPSAPTPVIPATPPPTVFAAPPAPLPATPLPDPAAPQPPEADTAAAARAAAAEETTALPTTATTPPATTAANSVPNTVALATEAPTSAAAAPTVPADSTATTTAVPAPVATAPTAADVPTTDPAPEPTQETPPAPTTTGAATAPPTTAVAPPTTRARAVPTTVTVGGTTVPVAAVRAGADGVPGANGLWSRAGRPVLRLASAVAAGAVPGSTMTITRPGAVATTYTVQSRVAATTAEAAAAVTGAPSGTLVLVIATGADSWTVVLAA